MAQKAGVPADRAGEYAAGNSICTACGNARRSGRRGTRSRNCDCVLGGVGAAGGNGRRRTTATVAGGMVTGPDFLFRWDVFFLQDADVRKNHYSSYQQESFVLLVLTQLPGNFVEHAEEDFGIGGFDAHTANHATELLFGELSGFRVDVFAFAKSRKKGLRDSFNGFGFGVFAVRRCCFQRFGARQVIQANGDSLAEVQGLVFFARWNMHRPMTMA